MDDVLDELYGLAPEDFTSHRDAAATRARRAGDRELAQRIRALRRPTLAAWACNLLVRAHDEQTRRFLALGEALRRAQEELDTDRLRELLAQQHELVAALSEQAAGTAADSGHRLGATARQEVEQTLLAVLADPEAARAWSAGRLTRPLHAPAELPTITAKGRATTRGRERKPDQAARRARQRAEQRLAEARRRVEELSAALDQAEQAVRQAEREVEAATREG
ncbi:hypothetical protein E1265_15665 [Streptomyces sp. 8K308]|nr:hypothetical protein E1265_15665 [Streptomyces sp. 8K308]